MQVSGVHLVFNEQKERRHQIPAARAFFIFLMPNAAAAAAVRPSGKSIFETWTRFKNSCLRAAGLISGAAICFRSSR